MMTRNNNNNNNNTPIILNDLRIEANRTLAENKNALLPSVQTRNIDPFLRTKTEPFIKSSSELNISGRSGNVFEQLIAMPVLHLIYQFVGRIKSFDQLRNIKLGLGALLIYYAGFLAFLLHVGLERDLMMN